MIHQPLKKSINLPFTVGEDTEVITIDITMRSIEVIERVWNKGLDSIIVDLSGAANIRRYLVADVIAQWVPFGASKLNQMQLKEIVMTSPPEKFAMYAGLILSVASYSLHYMNEDDFTTAVGTLTSALKPKPKEAQPVPKKERRRSSSKVHTKS